MLAMARGFQATVRSSGSPDNAIVRRAGASAEMESAVTLDQVRVISDAPQIARDDQRRPLVSAEAVVIAAFQLASSGTDANVQVRGVSPAALRVRPTIDLVRGRFFRPGTAELVVGRNVVTTYRGFEIGGTVQFGGQTWRVVGLIDAGGSAFDSELWCDTSVLAQTYKRPENIFQSVTVRLSSPDAFSDFKDTLTSDPRLTVQVDRESTYYAEQSQVVTTLIQVLGLLVALVMGIGAVFGALNTMYSAVAARVREIATMRALGFGAPMIVASFVFESVLIASLGGALGCLAALPLNGFTASTINWQTFSHLAFSFRVTPDLLLIGLAFALLMGLLGGVLPALRAARLPIASALREL
jgi:putative ABC transport system permease protein